MQYSITLNRSKIFYLFHEEDIMETNEMLERGHADELEQQIQQTDLSLDELLPIFGTADPRILFYRDYCGDFSASK